MATNLAAKRAAKAQRRKAVVAAKRAADLEAGSLAGQIRDAAKAPILHCLLSDGVHSVGTGILLLERGYVGGRSHLAAFLLDTLELGIEEVSFQSVTHDVAAIFRTAMARDMAMRAIDPADARKLLHDLVAWAGERGRRPHRDYTTVERLFGDVDAGAGSRTVTFGTMGMLAGSGDADDMHQAWRERVGSDDAEPLEFMEPREAAREEPDATGTA